MHMKQYIKRSVLAAVAAIMVSALAAATNPAAAQTLPEFRETARETAGAIVNINTVRTVRAPSRGMQFGGPNDPFHDFFDRFLGPRQNVPRKQQSLGSGFILSTDGHVVTNNHVVAGADEISVTLQGGEDTFQAEVIGTDPETDLALLKVDAGKPLPTLEFGDSDELEIGQWVVAGGNPFGLSHTFTAGIISATGRIIGAGPFDDFIQTDASINPGNSGGPLMNLEGEVIGINTAIIASGQGIGFAVPANMAQDIVRELREHKKVRRGMIGVAVQPVDNQTAKALGLDEAGGALVAEVMKDQPAEKAGIEPGDVIMEVEGEPVDDPNELTSIVAGKKPGTRVEMLVYRDGKTKTYKVTLTERRTLQTAEKPQKQERDGPAIGVTVRNLTEEEADSLDIDKGLLVMSVVPGAPAAEAGLAPGDVLVEAAQQPVGTVDELREVLESTDKDVVMLRVKRRGRSLFLTMSMKRVG